MYNHKGEQTSQGKEDLVQSNKEKLFPHCSFRLFANCKGVSFEVVELEINLKKFYAHAVHDFDFRFVA